VGRPGFDGGEGGLYLLPGLLLIRLSVAFFETELKKKLKQKRRNKGNAFVVLLVFSK